MRGAELLTAVDPEDVARNTLITMFAPQISHTSLLLKEQPASSIIRAPSKETALPHTHPGREREREGELGLFLSPDPLSAGLAVWPPWGHRRPP